VSNSVCLDAAWSRLVDVLFGGVPFGDSVTVLFTEEGAGADLGEVLVGGEGVGDAEVLHHDEGEAVGQPQSLSGRDR
jgi:hypothetical protein